MEKIWYYEYDPNSLQYIRAIFSDIQPDNTTVVAPEGIVGTTTFDKSSNKWVGETVEEWQEKNKDNTPENNVDALKLVFEKYQTLNDKTISALMLQVANQSKQIDVLKNNGGGSNV